MVNFPDPIRVHTNGIELEVFAEGAGKPIVLCHGWPEMAFSWRHQITPLAQAGYHVIVPNQRGYGHSSRPETVESYDIHHLCADLMGVLDHYGYEEALFVGHDWGAIVVWNLAMLHRSRVCGVVNLSVPFMERGPTEWVGFWESRLGGDFYIVHFNRQPGVADAVFAANTENMLRNMYRTNQWKEAPPDLGEGMPIINMATAKSLPGELLMSEPELATFVSAFEHSGFTGGINWYRNFTRNWETTAEIEQKVEQPALMIYGQHDSVPQFPKITDYVPNIEVHTLDCGHWIQQERPQETNQIMLNWLATHYPPD